MDEKNQRKIEKMEERLQSLELFKVRTIEQLKTLFNTVDEIKKSNRWMSQSFIYLLAGGIISGITSLLIWLIQR